MSEPAPAVTGSDTHQTAPDPEVTAIGKVNEALSGLDPEMQQRVLRWAASKFKVTVAQTKTPADDDGHDEEEEQEPEPATPDTPTDIALLYDAANPSTEADKALVIGYWLQVIQGNSDWTGFSVNKALNNLGHGVKNITVALSALIDSTPRLVMQTHKSGKAKQARKKYKMTNEGIKRVKQMLAGNSGQD